MKINFNNSFNFVRTKFNKISQKTATIVDNIRMARKEAEISKYIMFRNEGTYTSPIVTDLYRMREPIANFAKAHNITIDVYNPQILSKEKPSPEGVPEKFALLVSNPKNKKMKVEIFDGNPSVVYPKEQLNHRLINVPGEDTQIIRVVKRSVEDSALTHVFRTLENMVKFVK